ncbi:FAD-dependent thymidylate synthase [Anoxynatronum buryatiense]|uniref:Flavin-dependent thymidylate synthase n=1 Tax=Anoxynatronum buryatiense TaxID=489973 RepID=A0AA46AKD7_9CLOT|nr:FAD-dependent thymidylate synthase [Anoxynatronum buryatiense]SMP69918.1 thymidylate synthase (FAD) [Anoxynatronum buryatiense]
METTPRVDLIAHTPEPEKVVAAAARLCYSSHGVTTLLDEMSDAEIKRLVGILSDMGHQSPFEHVSFTFAIEGVSRSLTHQLVRHRIASFSQKSQRYVREGGFDYVIPEAIEEDDALKIIYLKAMADQQAAYDQLADGLKEKHLKQLVNEGLSEKKAAGIAEKAAIEDARYVLPNACETKIVVTMNARSLLHFFNVRCCNRAQWEIRVMATEMLRQVKQTAPNLFRVAGPDCVSGPCGEGAMSCGKSREVAEQFRNL